MTFKLAEATLSADVAINGTFTVSYPAGTSAGSFSNTWGHKMWSAAHQKMYSAPGGFTLAFGASSITVTYLGSTTLPSGSRVRLQLDMYGDDTRNPERAILPVTAARAPNLLINLGAPAAGASNNIATSQSVAAGASFSINGTLLSGTKAVMDVPRNIVAAWTTASVLTITGTDADGNTVVEKSASGTSHTGKKAFKTVTSISSSASITGATVGTGNVLGLPIFVPEASFIRAEFMDGSELPRKPGKVFIPFEIEQTELLAPTAEQIVCPVAGWIARVRGIVQGAVTTGGPVTVEVNTVAVTGLTFTIADADAAGTRYADTPTTRHSSTTIVAAGDQLTITPGAAINTAGQLNGMLEIDVSPSGMLDGTFVAGVTSAATGTTGDTRGTYAPSVTPDGATAFALLISSPAPADDGVPQYVG